jgi:uncharacterized protein YuzE
MKVTFDKVADAIYFSLREGKVVRTTSISNAINIDIDEAGRVLGIEVLDVTNQFETDNIAEIEKRVLEGIPLNIISNTPATA